jgi:hypothetical protein
VIATDYSGNTDFCTPDNSYPVPYRLVGVPAGAARWRCDDALWADADIAAAAAQMQAVFENREVVAEKAERARLNIKSKYAIEIFAAALRTRIDAIRAAGNLLGLDRAGVVNMTRTVARATNFRD